MGYSTLTSAINRFIDIWHVFALTESTWNRSLKCNYRDVKERHAVRRVGVSGVVEFFVVVKVFIVCKSNFNHNSMNG